MPGPHLKPRSIGAESHGSKLGIILTIEFWKLEVENGHLRRERLERGGAVHDSADTIMS